ncbi:hypothetical protein [Alteromonas antoniana]|uniref:hypothetical protein n=1 Tax=Alteromonas antoniana TaxID=2803813 RepID=UPI001C47F3B8|nr:hypothetical protein [Alteromonas antoniana]
MDKLSKHAFTKVRRELSKSTLKEVSNQLKSYKWKKYQYMLWKQTNDLFWTVNIRTHLNALKTTIDLGVKPLEIDNILWNIMDIKENHEMPTSFRSVGAFTCTEYPLDSITYDNDVENDDLVGEIVHWITNRYLEVKSPFSALYRNHPNYMERGSYAIPLVCSLISEEQLDEAVQVANSFESGAKSSALAMTNLDGNSFFFHALNHLKR